MKELFLNEDDGLYITYRKADGSYTKYKKHNLTSQIGYYKRQGKQEQVNRLETLLSKLESVKV